MSEPTWWQTTEHWLRTHQTTLRLAGSYLFVMMIMSIGFSFIFYRTSVHELERQLPPNTLFLNNPYYLFHDYLAARINEGKAQLLQNLFVVNLIILLLGSVLSYLLARRTLEPIEEAFTVQTRFAADASHELRTPLAALQAENEVALRNPTLTLERAKEILKSNLEEIMRLQKLAEGLLRLTRGTGVLALSSVAIMPVIDQAISLIKTLAAGKQITVVAEPTNLSAQADADSLVEVLHILIDNAVKYSPAQTAVHLRTELHGSEVLLHVQDEGAGIARDDQARIFERFYRADPSRSKQHVEGNGLGLAIAGTLMEAMHGSISVESAPGKGSTFTLHLPHTSGA